MDDNGPFRQTLKQSPQMSFPTVTNDEVADGGKVLRKVAAFLPALISMHIKSPEINGLELTKKIKPAHPDITIFSLTSYDILEYREAAFQYGADRFLAKTPLNLIELEESVKSCQKV